MVSVSTGYSVEVSSSQYSSSSSVEVSIALELYPLAIPVVVFNVGVDVKSGLLVVGPATFKVEILDTPLQLDHSTVEFMRGTLVVKLELNVLVAVVPKLDKPS